MNKEEVEKLGLQKGDILLIKHGEYYRGEYHEEYNVGIYKELEHKHWDPDWNDKEFTDKIILLWITKKVIYENNALKWERYYEHYDRFDIDNILELSKLGNIVKDDIESILAKKI